MDLPSEAFRDLQRCGPALFRYVVAVLLTLCSYHCISWTIDIWLPAADAPGIKNLATLCATLYFASLISAVQAVYLSILGAAIDKPLWKYKGAKDALQRFFILWLLINLFLITLVDIQSRLMASDIQDTAMSLEPVILVGHVLALPVGACIMHWGAFHWHELGESLRPFTRLFSLMLIPMLIGFVQYSLINVRSMAATDNMAFNIPFFILTDIPLVLIEAYIFTLVWRICMHHRSLPPETEDPFDF